MCVVAESADVVKLACPLPFSAVGPASRTPGAAHVPPSKNETLPAGVPLPAVTVALKVRELPYVEGFVPAVKLIEVDVEPFSEKVAEASILPPPPHVVFLQT